MISVVDRFLHYSRFDTASNEHSSTIPSTDTQRLFGKELVKELRQLGLKDAKMNKNGYIMATLPANISSSTPTIGFIAHLDTSPDLSGKNIKAQIIKNYPGGDILLNKNKSLYLYEAEFPELKLYHGQDLIVTDGTTLLGADDKAGIAEIITAMEYLYKHPEIPHPRIRIAFTPDEEIGRGADNFDLTEFGANFAYTVDGGELGQIETENFNAASALFTITGKNVHPGTAKNKMVNSMLFIKDILDFFPADETPSQTEGYEGFFHVVSILGSVEKTQIKYIIRDHDRIHFEERKQIAKQCAEYLNSKYGKDLVSLELEDSYYNMSEVLVKYPQITNLAIRAMQEVGIKPVLTPIRGGTDGARLSFMGLPTPNLFTGGHNFHGRYEFIPIPSMTKAVETIIKICEFAKDVQI
jgi:tripeptide aminopeptidase